MKAIKNIEFILVAVILFLVPVLVLPIFPNVYITPKLLFLSWGVAIVLILKAIHTFISREVKFSTATFDVPILLLVIAVIVGVILKVTSKMDALLLPGTATLLVSSGILYFIINQFDETRKKLLRLPLILSATLASVFSLFSVAGVFRSIASLPAFMKEPNFTLLEGTLTMLVFLLSVLPFAIHLLISEKDTVLKALYGILSGLIIFGSIIAFYFSLPGKSTSPQLPSFTASWIVAADTLKESPLLGSGSGNYLISFNRFRPLAYNATDLWATRFSTARDFYLTLITETGLIGAAALFLIGARLLYSLKNLGTLKDEETNQFNFKAISIISLVVLALLLVLFPSSTSLVMLLFVLLALASKTHKMDINLFSARNTEDDQVSKTNWMTRLPVTLIAGPTIILVVLFMVFSAQAHAAEFTFRRALEAIVANNGKDSYDLLVGAIRINPYVDRYRTTYSQVNLSLANSIAGQQNLTDDQKNTVSQLIQQAIAEGKAGVVLNPLKAGNWELLASIYRAIIPLAQGADQFSVQSMQQAIALDPINPNLRITLGGIYYQLKAYDAAIDTFKLAVASKPDLANAHYNLAIAYREAGKYQNAITEMNNVLTLVDKDSKDYELAQKELENLKKDHPEAVNAGQNQNGETLQAPEQGPEGTPTGTLPPNAQPPAAIVTPSPASSSTPIPVETPSPTANP